MYTARGVSSALLEVSLVGVRVFIPVRRREVPEHREASPDTQRSIKDRFNRFERKELKQLF